MSKVNDFLNETGMFFMATVDGDQLAVVQYKNQCPEERVLFGAFMSRSI